MITAELSDFLEINEKESVLRGISASDKILSSGICQFLVAENGQWRKPDEGAAVALFLKNSTERYYRIIVMEPSADPDWEPTIQFDFLIRDKRFETIQEHARLLVFEAESRYIGLNFYDSKECENFHNSVCKRQTRSTDKAKQPALEGKKKKKSSFYHNPFKSHKEPRKQVEFGAPIDFRHVDGLKLTDVQEDLYMQVRSRLNVNNPEEEEEIVKQLIVRNEDHIRQSLMVKKESQTVKGVKDKHKDKVKTSKSFFGRNKPKVEDVSQPIVPVITGDPLNPDWTVTAATSFKHSHTFAAIDPIKTTDWETPRKDTYGSTNQRQPQNIYKFEQEHVEQTYQIEKIEVDDTPTELPSRGASRNPEDQMTRGGLSTPRIPTHRDSYRWATKPDTVPKQTPPPTPNAPSHSHQVDQFAEFKLVEPKTPTRVAPPPPPSAPPTIKFPISTGTSYSSTTPPTTPKPAPPPPSRIPNPSPSPQPAEVSKSPPPPPPLPPIATPSSVPPPPPPPPALEQEISGPPTVRLTAVPESNSDRRSLMDQIRSIDRSQVLRKVSDTPDTRQSVPSPTSGTIVDQIQNFLDARRSGINPSDSEESEYSTVTAATSFKHSHTFSADPIKDPSVLLNRSASVRVRGSLSTSRIPPHWDSYRWTTKPDTVPKQTPPPTHNSNVLPHIDENDHDEENDINEEPPKPPRKSVSFRVREKPIAEAPLRPPARPAPIVPTSAGLSLVLAASLPTSSTPSRFLNPFPAPLPAESFFGNSKSKIAYFIKPTNEQPQELFQTPVQIEKIFSSTPSSPVSNAAIIDGMKNISLSDSSTSVAQDIAMKVPTPLPRTSKIISASSPLPPSQDEINPLIEMVDQSSSKSETQIPVTECSQNHLNGKGSAAQIQSADFDKVSNQLLSIKVNSEKSEQSADVELLLVSIEKLIQNYRGCHHED
ncbi:WH1 domain-containing protein [Caenorhabditis elegans]|uniref:WH1 domain-containing protein n=1 Tax=Caenorhabditis elegans TaxID=6239 RepID=Q8I4M6_CAEEL|nr:WH1 domain-containing protein [Caenorhabditis elegans]CAD57687.2 WH1 domain-containing protein [Caenorhabditis elegans]|eukprot:NP_872049.2 Uncharacterized protein CELE_C31C9.6 [Caenorhabditis elegans]